MVCLVSFDSEGVDLDRANHPKISLSQSKRETTAA
jgi:hypothetical protein